MPTPKKTPSLATKKAFIVKSRRANYRDSLRLEGVKASLSKSPNKAKSKAAVIAKYRVITNK